MLILQAPAKINWCLYVLGKRPDGYHEIWSIMQKISLYDTLKIQRIPEDRIKVEVEPDIGVKQEENLVYRAAMLLKDYTGFNGGARITVKKEIPLQAGLGGGSSDAAYTLMGLNRLWGLGLDRTELVRIGSEVGSDVPFFFADSVAVVKGRGEHIEPVFCNKEVCLLLVKPSFGVSTGLAYRSIKRYSDINDMKLIESFTSGNIEGFLKKYFHNDLEEAVIEYYPELRSIKRDLVNCRAMGALMSGSGSTVFGVFRGAEDAVAALEKLKDRYWVRIVNTLVKETSFTGR